MILFDPETETATRVFQRHVYHYTWELQIISRVYRFASLFFSFIPVDILSTSYFLLWPFFFLLNLRCTTN